ncbi:carbohydrate binding domain-containing protein [Streptomyces sp. NPDC001165]|uniref:carbohydrate binding domain-containing protein n=1 Tax=Streptomyces sp. NPDC001165 TaxID=3364546 RepID=UPI0036C6F6C5
MHVTHRPYQAETRPHGKRFPAGRHRRPGPRPRLGDRNYLSLGAGSSVTNAGYNTGIALEEGKKYDFSVWARAEAGSTLTVTVQNAGGTLATARQIAVRKGGWARYRATFTATRTSTAGRRTVASSAAAALDMVSLFPRDTYRSSRPWTAASPR